MLPTSLTVRWTRSCCSAITTSPPTAAAPIPSSLSKATAPSPRTLMTLSPATPPLSPPLPPSSFTLTPRRVSALTPSHPSPPRRSVFNMRFSNYLKLFEFTWDTDTLRYMKDGEVVTEFKFQDIELIAISTQSHRNETYSKWRIYLIGQDGVPSLPHDSEIEGHEEFSDKMRSLRGFQHRAYAHAVLTVKDDGPQDTVSALVVYKRPKDSEGNWLPVVFDEVAPQGSISTDEFWPTESAQAETQADSPASQATASKKQDVPPVATPKTKDAGSGGESAVESSESGMKTDEGRLAKEKKEDEEEEAQDQMSPYERMKKYFGF